MTAIWRSQPSGKSGVMNGTKHRGLVPDQRRRVAVCVLVLAQHEHVPVAAVVSRQPKTKPFRGSNCCGAAKATIRLWRWPVTWVGVAGFEPAASSSRTKRAAKLRHTPATAYGV